MNRLIYDIEIAKCIQSGPQLDGVEYCKGWGDYEGMGIAVIAYKYNQEDTQIAFSALEFFDYLLEIQWKGDYKIIGFNSKSFDDKLLAANDLEGVETHYDLLEEVRIAAGFEASFRSVPKGFSYKLDAIAKTNNMAKTGHGALAPLLWQQGKKDEVVDYCKHDVEITSAILDLGLVGELIDPNTGNKLQLAGLD